MFNAVPNKFSYNLSVEQSVKRDTFDIYSFDSYNLGVLGNSLVVGQRTLDPPG